MVISLDHEAPDDPQDPFRIVNLCNHSGASLRWRVAYNSKGQLVEADLDRGILGILDSKLLPQISPLGLTRPELDVLADEIGPAASRRVLDQWLQEAVDSGELRRTGRTRDTRYFKVQPS
jgi:hypothetical protein